MFYGFNRKIIVDWTYSFANRGTRYIPVSDPQTGIETGLETPSIGAYKPERKGFSRKTWCLRIT